MFFFFFFFSSRRRHTRYWRDWSSDVCSSDLDSAFQALHLSPPRFQVHLFAHTLKLYLTAAPEIRYEQFPDTLCHICGATFFRSEERRVGKECRSRWWQDH